MKIDPYKSKERWLNWKKKARQGVPELTRSNSGFKPGVVLDPFIGSGTTAVVAKKLGMNFLGFDLNPNYVEIANRRLKNEI